MKYAKSHLFSPMPAHSETFFASGGLGSREQEKYENDAESKIRDALAEALNFNY